MLDPIFNMHKIKFGVMDKLFNDIDIEAKTVNVFINLESVLNKLNSSNTENYLRTCGDSKNYEFISNIVNLAAHYRWYFNKVGLKSKVYLYITHPFNHNFYKNRAILSDYRQSYERKYSRNGSNIILSKIANESIQFAKIILEYVEDINLITSNHLDGSLIPLIVSEEKPADLNVIISSDRYDYQYSNRDFIILRPKKEDSYLINKENLISKLMIEEKYTKKSKINSGFYSFILSVIGNKDRNIPKIKGMGISKVISLLNKGVKEGYISDTTFNINLLLNVIKEDYRKIILDNYYCTDIDLQSNLLNSKDKHVVTSQLVNKFDNPSLKKINDDFFMEHPLLIMEMDQFKQKPKTKNIFMG